MLVSALNEKNYRKILTISWLNVVIVVVCVMIVWRACTTKEWGEFS